MSAPFAFGDGPNAKKTALPRFAPGSDCLQWGLLHRATIEFPKN